MKKIIYTVLATISGLVLVFSYRTSLDAVAPVAAEKASTTDSTGATTQTTTPDTTGSESDSDADSAARAPSGSASGSSGSSGSSATQSTAPATTSGLNDGTFTGSAVNTRFGPVQVQITVSGGRIVDVQVPQYPSSNPKDQQINQRALPTLIAETTQSQGAGIDMVSGATYTSQGYLSSLQSAIDQAHA